MEEYEQRQLYLRHLKKIAQIRDSNKHNLPYHSILSPSRINESTIFNRNSLKKQSTQYSKLIIRNNSSSDRILRNRVVQNQNRRLVNKILTINSTIKLKKYNKQYLNTQQFPLNKDVHQKLNQQYLHFRFYDIKFINNNPNTQQQYKIQLISHKKKYLIVEGRMSEIRKKQIKVKKGKIMKMKISCEQDFGICKIQQNGLVDIIKKGAKNGYIIIQYINK